MNPIETLAKACALTQKQVDAAMTAPNAQTGCADWDATQLVNHMVFGLGMWADIFSGGQPQGDPFNAPHVLGDDMAADFAAAVQRVIEVVSVPGVLDQVLPSPAGEMPAAALITFPTYDVFVHGWDLSKATGLPAEHPDDLVAIAMGFAQQSFADERPPHVVGPEVQVAPDASAFDKMLAFNGRQP